MADPSLAFLCAARENNEGCSETKGKGDSYLEDFSSPYLPFWISITKLLVELFYQLGVHLLLFLDLADILVQISALLHTGFTPFFGLPRPFFALFTPPLAFLVPSFLV